jgi:hypothetical protein
VTNGVVVDRAKMALHFMAADPVFTREGDFKYEIFRCGVACVSAICHKSKYLETTLSVPQDSLPHRATNSQGDDDECESMTV